MKYFLCGKIQTDALEERFGKYRYLAGCQYNVSIRQIFECESKLRLQSSFSLYSKTYGKIIVNNFNFHQSWQDFEQSCDYNFNISVTNNDLESEKDVMPVITFLAGYCVYTICKRYKCESCQHQLTYDRELICDNEMYQLITDLDRGGLKFPNEDVIFIVLHCYIVAKKFSLQNMKQNF